MSLSPPAPLHILVTAGPTREMIDAVRDWGNIFSGNTGLDLARAFLALGNVTLLTSNPEHAREFDGYSAGRGMIGTEFFRSHGDLLELLTERMTSRDRVDVVAMTAAVADYQPAGAYQIVRRDAGTGGEETWTVRKVGGDGAGKVKSSFDDIAIRGTRTSKLIDMFRTPWGFEGTLIKFKLEVGLSDEQLLAVARDSRLASRADLIVANTLAMARLADGSAGGAYLVDERDATRVTRAELARAVVEWTQRKLATDARG